MIFISFFCLEQIGLWTRVYFEKWNIFERTMFAKLFGVKAPLSSKDIAQNPGKNNVGDTKIKLNINNEDLMRMLLKLRQLRCDCHLPVPLPSSPRTASLSSRWPGARGRMAEGMCSFLPFISRPGVSIFWASRICRGRGRSPAFSTRKLNVVGSRLLAGCSSVKCRAIELAWTLPLICFSWVSSLAWALNPVSPLYLFWHKVQVPV